MTKRWDEINADSAQVDDLAEALKVSPLLCKLLVQRGVTGYDQAKSFFRPQLEDLHDPFLMKDMDLATERLQLAIQKGQKILLYGDYDVDGTTCVATLWTFLRRIYKQVDYYIPDRYKEGYGISTRGIQYAIEQGVDLIIAMDCGIKAVDRVKEARDAGIDFVICDHHLPDGELPAAVAILDAKRSDCNYPYKELSGCGVVMKFIQAYCQIAELDFKDHFDLLEYVVISIACDIVPITGENRVMAFYGLQYLNKTQSVGLKSLIRESERRAPLKVSDLVFGIGPMINAVGRLSDAKYAVKLLITKDSTEADEIAMYLKYKNHQRKAYDKQIAEEAKRLVDSDPNSANDKSIVLFDPNWHKGVVGIAASRVVEMFGKPAIILTQAEGIVVGSARSVMGFDINSAIRSCKDMLLNYGGHKYAAGLSMEPDQVDAFRQKFEDVVASSITAEQLTPKIHYSTMLPFDEITPKFFRILRQFAPFGPGNRNPVFISRRVNVVGKSRLLKEEHLKLAMTQDNKLQYSGIAFRQKEHYPRVDQDEFDVCYTIEENEWKGRKSLQLNIKDLQF